MNINKLLIIFTSLLIIGCSSTSKKNNDKIQPILFGQINNENFLIGINQDELHYTFKLTSKDLRFGSFNKLKGDNSAYNFFLDKKTTISLLNFNVSSLKRTDGKQITDKDKLDFYLKLELDRSKKIYGSKVKLSNKYVKHKLIQGYFWTTTYPKQNKKAPLKTLGISMIKNNKYIVIFRTDMKRGIKASEDKYRKLLIKAALTIRESSTPINNYNFDMLVDIMKSIENKKKLKS